MGSNWLIHRVVTTGLPEIQLYINLNSSTQHLQLQNLKHFTVMFTSSFGNHMDCSENNK